MHHLQILKNKLEEAQGSFNIPLTGDRTMQVTPVYCNNEIIGVTVDNLGNSPYLPMDVFVATISLLSLNPDNTAIKGSAQGGSLGCIELPINSVEGHVASIVYGDSIGEHVFRRITPISRILEWAGVCQNGLGWLRLNPI